MVQLVFSFPLTPLYGNSFMFDWIKQMYMEQMYYMIMIVMFLHLTFYKIMCFKNSCIQNSKGGMLQRHTECFFLQAAPSPPISFFGFRLK